MSDQTISKFDRIRGGMQDVALFTKPTTIQNIESITGKSETFIVETCRFEDKGDFIFLQVIDETGVTRVVLPPKVVAAIDSHGDRLTSRRRSAAAKRTARERMDRGEVPGFMRKKKGAPKK
ncbi:MAG TPA: hypothetical protein VKB76_02670 [Ktedonobacterales bacterium]|nr:hypothetical protein [Ktedonobacterales bacterium]